MKRSLALAVAALVVAGACGGGSSEDEGSSSGGASGAAAPFTPAPPAGAATVPTEPGSYNYSPAVMDEGDKVKAWWCSAKPAQATDNIWYQEYDKKTKQYSGRRSVLQVGRPGTSDWDSFGVCHPSVIKGEWPNPKGAPFQYALYYTSTNTATGGGSGNSTGVVFSTDGVTWSGQHDRYNPMIKQKVPGVAGSYGAGLPSAWSRGGSKVTLFWIDTTAEKSSAAGSGGYQSRILVADSDDGIHFGAPTLVSRVGAPAYWKNDYAFDGGAQPAVVYSAQAGAFRAGSAPDHKNETFNFGLFKIPRDEMLAGAGQWQQLAIVDTNLTGLPLNFEPGLVRKPDGAVAGDVEKDGIEVWFGGGGQTPGTWGLRTITLHRQGDRLPLRQYAAGGSYWATTGFVPQAFRTAKAETLGYLDINPAAGEVALYGCQRGPLATTPTGELTGAGADRFLSLEPCEGVHQLGINGYVFPQPPAGTDTRPLYACKDGRAQFVSGDAKCGGKAVERLLGYARAG